jgi:hypothetical protein
MVGAWPGNAIPLSDLVGILALVAAPPNLRRQPRGADRTDRDFEEWFDGGGIFRVTGGATHYVLDNGTDVKVYGFAPGLRVVVEFPDGRSVTIEQASGD